MNKKYNTEIFIEKCKVIHNNKYDYSKTIYNKINEKILIICKKHGIFQQSASMHLRGQGCPMCANKNINTEKFIEKSLSVHGNIYSYDKTVYISAKNKILITCKKHGDFYQTPDAHIRGQGCPKCSGFGLDKEEIISLFDKIHNYHFNYNDIDYTNPKTKLKIKCPTHGFFYQTRTNHLQGKGCPKCRNQISKPEIELQDFIKSLNLKIETNKRNIIKPYELDIYIPELNRAVEFNGEYWHYHKDNFIAGKHAFKSNLCRKKGIKLLYIREDLWLKDKEKMKNIIIKFLNNEKTKRNCYKPN